MLNIWYMGKRIGEASHPGPCQVSRIIISDGAGTAALRDQLGKTFKQAFDDKDFVEKFIKRKGKLTPQLAILQNYFKAKLAKQELEALGAVKAARKRSQAPSSALVFAKPPRRLKWDSGRDPTAADSSESESRLLLLCLFPQSKF